MYNNLGKRVITMMYVVTAGILLLLVLYWFIPIKPWFAAKNAGLHVSLVYLIGMRFRRISPMLIVIPYIRLREVNIEASLSQLEIHHLAGGNVNAVADALIAAQHTNTELSFEEAAAADLAG